MTTVYDVDANELIARVAKQLKEKKMVSPPQWAAFAKTGMHKQRPPVEDDWWYIRSAAVLRTVYKYDIIGVSRIRTKYGGRKNRGYDPEKFFKGSGSVARKVLQQLEASGLLKKGQKGVHKGRILTGEGRSFLDNIAAEISGKEIAVK